MSTKQPKTPSKSATTKPARNTKTKLTAKRTAASPKRPTPGPESVLRYSGQVFCVIGLPTRVAEHLGPELTNTILKEFNEISLRFCFQNEKAVINLTSFIYASVV